MGARRARRHEAHVITLWLTPSNADGAISGAFTKRTERTRPLARRRWACSSTSTTSTHIIGPRRPHEVAKEAGAEIVHPPKDADYGRNYWANDPEGHPWFSTEPPKEG